MKKVIVIGLSVLMCQYVYAADEIRSALLLNSSVELYKKAEWKLTLNVVFSNPYDNSVIALDLLLKAPSGRQIELPCFYKEGRSGELTSWGARFAAQETGLYSYSFRLTYRGKRITTDTKSFHVKVSASQGFLHVRNSWTLGFDSGKPFRGFGENVGWEGRLQDDPHNTFDHFLPEIVANGGNFFRTFMNHWNLPVEWNITEVPRRTNRLYKNSVSKYHQAGIKRMDELVEMADSLGLYFMPMIEWQNNLRADQAWPLNPYNAKNGGPAQTPTDFFTNAVARSWFKNRLRYIVARWGYATSIAAWELMNEVDNAAFNKFKDIGGDADRDTIVIPHAFITKWHSEMAAYLKQIDPYHHIVTTSISHRPIKGLFDVPEIDINQEHIYRRTGSIPAALNSRVKRYGKPFVIGEFGYRWENGDPRYWHDFYYHFRQGLWFGLFNPTPVLPLTWWWELFDSKKGLTVLKGIHEINARMLVAGNGSFVPVRNRAGSFVTYSVQCGKTTFIYLLNNDSTRMTSTVYLDNISDSGNIVSSFDPSTLKYAAVKDLKPDSALVFHVDITLETQEDKVLIVSPKGQSLKNE